MSKSNPRKAVTAIMPLPLQVGTENGEPLVVRPMTLAMYAALERIGSPLLTGQEPENALDWLPTLYLVTHDPSEIFSGNLADKAFAWADAQPVSIVRHGSPSPSVLRFPLPAVKPPPAVQRYDIVPPVP